MTRPTKEKTTTPKRRIISAASAAASPSIVNYIAKKGDFLELCISFQLCLCIWKVTSSTLNNNGKRLGYSFSEHFYKGSPLEALIYSSFYDNNNNTLKQEVTITKEFIDRSRKNVINAFDDDQKMKFKKSIEPNTIKKSILLVYRNH